MDEIKREKEIINTSIIGIIGMPFIDLMDLPMELAFVILLVILLFLLIL